MEQQFKPTPRELSEVRAHANHAEWVMREQARIRGDLPAGLHTYNAGDLTRWGERGSRAAFALSQRVAARALSEPQA